MCYGGTHADGLPSWAVCVPRHTQRGLAMLPTPSLQGLPWRAGRKEKGAAARHSAGSTEDSGKCLGASESKTGKGHFLP